MENSLESLPSNAFPASPAVELMDSEALLCVTLLLSNWMEELLGDVISFSAERRLRLQFLESRNLSRNERLLMKLENFESSDLKKVDLIGLLYLIQLKCQIFDQFKKTIPRKS